MKTSTFITRVLFIVLLFSLDSTVSYSQDKSVDSYRKTEIPAIKIPKTNIISFGFFSPVNQHISFGYDREMGDGMILAFQAGIIGPGFNNNSPNQNTDEKIT